MSPPASHPPAPLYTAPCPLLLMLMIHTSADRSSGGSRWPRDRPCRCRGRRLFREVSGGVIRTPPRDNVSGQGERQSAISLLLYIIIWNVFVISYPYKPYRRS